MAPKSSAAAKPFEDDLTGLEKAFYDAAVKAPDPEISDPPEFEPDAPSEPKAKKESALELLKKYWDDISSPANKMMSVELATLDDVEKGKFGDGAPLTPHEAAKSKELREQALKAHAEFEAKKQEGAKMISLEAERAKRKAAENALALSGSKEEQLEALAQLYEKFVTKPADSQTLKPYKRLLRKGESKPQELHDMNQIEGGAITEERLAKMAAGEEPWTLNGVWTYMRELRSGERSAEITKTDVVQPDAKDDTDTAKTVAAVGTGLAAAVALAAAGAPNKRAPDPKSPDAIASAAADNVLAAVSDDEPNAEFNDLTATEEEISAKIEEVSHALDDERRALAAFERDYDLIRQGLARSPESMKRIKDAEKGLFAAKAEMDAQKPGTFGRKTAEQNLFRAQEEHDETLRNELELHDMKKLKALMPMMETYAIGIDVIRDQIAQLERSGAPETETLKLYGQGLILALRNLDSRRESSPARILELEKELERLRASKENKIRTSAYLGAAGTEHKWKKGFEPDALDIAPNAAESVPIPGARPDAKILKFEPLSGSSGEGIEYSPMDSDGGSNDDVEWAERLAKLTSAKPAATQAKAEPKPTPKSPAPDAGEKRAEAARILSEAESKIAEFKREDLDNLENRSEEELRSKLNRFEQTRNVKATLVGRGYLEKSDADKLTVEELDSLMGKIKQAIGEVLSSVTERNKGPKPDAADAERQAIREEAHGKIALAESNFEKSDLKVIEDAVAKLSSANPNQTLRWLLDGGYLSREQAKVLFDENHFNTLLEIRSELLNAYERAAERKDPHQEALAQADHAIGELQKALDHYVESGSVSQDKLEANLNVLREGGDVIGLIGAMTARDYGSLGERLKAEDIESLRKRADELTQGAIRKMAERAASAAGEEKERVGKKKITRLNNKIQQKINPRPAIVVPEKIDPGIFQEIEKKVDKYIAAPDPEILNEIREWLGLDQAKDEPRQSAETKEPQEPKVTVNATVKLPEAWRRIANDDNGRYKGSTQYMEDLLRGELGAAFKSMSVHPDNSDIAVVKAIAPDGSEEVLGIPLNDSYRNLMAYYEAPGSRTSFETIKAIKRAAIFDTSGKLISKGIAEV